MVAQTFLSEPVDKNVCATERAKTIEKEYIFRKLFIIR